MSKTETACQADNETSNSINNKNQTDSQETKYDPLYYCRTCANKDSFFVPIFKGDGLSHQLDKKIEKYLPIHVTQDDDLPLQLCYNCASTIIAWDTLIIGCVEAEKKLNLLKNSDKDFVSLDENSADDEETEKADETYVTACDEIDTDDEPLIAKKLAIQKSNEDKKNDDIKEEECENKELELTGNEIDRIKVKVSSDELEEDALPCQDWNGIPKSWLHVICCKFCGKLSCKSKQLTQQDQVKTCVESFDCNFCQRNFTKKINLEKHLEKHERDRLNDANKKFSCGICNKKFKFEDNGLSHEKLCGKIDGTFKCSECGKRFETQVLAEQHSISHHKSCVCHMCGQLFNKPESLKQHIKTVHEDFKMVCHYCGKEFTRKARLQEHLQHHTGQMDFTCHVCGKGSTNSYSFSVHLATHTKEKPFSCSFCPRTFKHMKYVYLHERGVHLKLKSGKTYVKPKKPGKNVTQRTCPLCDKTFKRESAMLIHKRSVHEGKNGYICKVCGKDFKYTYLLYVHKKKQHFPELCKYICQFCNKPYPVKTELEKHLRKHTGEKPYKCNICGKTYSFHGSWNMHMKTQHENKKTFKCNTCGASFNFPSHLARHMNAHVAKGSR